MRDGPAPSELADADELRFREHVERYPDPASDIPRFIEGKELPSKLWFALEQAGIEPSGTVVELGAGTCWLAAELARLAQVRRVYAVDLSERRLRDLAPVALAYLSAPAEKVERVVADFYAHGLSPASADYVFMDAAFHHAADPVRLARVAHDLLRPGGAFVLLREPTLSLLRRHRDHGEEGEHGSFEREYTSAGYLEHLREAGFEASRHRAAGGFHRVRARMTLWPGVRLLNGVLFSEFTYVGRKPGAP
jgi:SAM-dependent methyltransferase